MDIVGLFFDNKQRDRTRCTVQRLVCQREIHSWNAGWSESRQDVPMDTEELLSDSVGHDGAWTVAQGRRWRRQGTIPSLHALIDP